MSQSVNELISNGCDCRTSPAKPGQLIGHMDTFLSVFLWTFSKLRNMLDIGNETVIVTTEMGNILVSETELPLEGRCFRG